MTEGLEGPVPSRSGQRNQSYFKVEKTGPKGRKASFLQSACSETPAKLQTRCRAWYFLGGGVVLKPRVLSGFWS